jgi:hypothetical protein
MTVNYNGNFITLAPDKIIPEYPGNLQPYFNPRKRKCHGKLQLCFYNFRHQIGINMEFTFLSNEGTYNQGDQMNWNKECPIF